MAVRQLKAKLVICSVPTRNSVASRKFYDTLLGGDDFARNLTSRVESYFRPISQDGLTLSVHDRQHDREAITCFFAVDNLDASVHELEAVGGRVIIRSAPLPVSGPPDAVKAFHDAASSRGEQSSDSVGDWATMIDPDGNYLGLVQLDAAMQAQFKADPAHRSLSPHQVVQQDTWKSQTSAID